MLRVEVNSNKDTTKMRHKVSSKKTNGLEAVYLMAVVYDLFKENDDSGITDKEIFDTIKNFKKQFDKQRKENSK